MLAGTRSRKVGDEILKEMAMILLESVKDPRTRDVTLTGIKLSKDLQRARVYYSVLGGSEEVRQAQTGLDSAKGFIKRQISLKMSLRYVPEIIFEHDPSLERGSAMERLLESIRKDAPENDAE
ncbi:Ribosome-binding factor A [uncultured Desulfatiglans sp.]|nr:Ribosome-binding factor A [uncultured Desulfatiglans sp.]